MVTLGNPRPPNFFTHHALRINFMRNPKSKTNRKIGPASTNTILSVRRATPACHKSPLSHPSHSSHSCPPRHESKPHNTEPATRSTPSSIQHPLSSIRPRTRNGKVARLPYAVRDMINRMLRNNIPHSQIVEALEELNFRVTERNISNWKTRGGYRDWCLAQ